MSTTSYKENDAEECASLSRHFLGEESDVENDVFKDRLRDVIGKESKRAFALRAGISPTAVRQYLSGKSLPTLDNLISATKAANVNLLWLATGEGPKHGESTTCAVDALNEEALVRALEVVEEVGAGVPLGKRARLLKLAYTLYIRSGSALDQASLKALVKEALSQTM